MSAVLSCLLPACNIGELFQNQEAPSVLPGLLVDVSDCRSAAMKFLLSAVLARLALNRSRFSRRYYP